MGHVESAVAPGHERLDRDGLAAERGRGLADGDDPHRRAGVGHYAAGVSGDGGWEARSGASEAAGSRSARRNWIQASVVRKTAASPVPQAAPRAPAMSAPPVIDGRSAPNPASWVNR